MLLKMNLLCISVVAVFLFIRSCSSEWAWEWDSGCKVLSPTTSVRLDSTVNGPCCKFHSEGRHKAILLGGENDTRIERVFRFEFGSLGMDTTPFVGISNSFMFEDLSSLTGALYGGKLHSGIAPLIRKFGQPIATGDVVTMKINREPSAVGNRVKVFFGHNDLTPGLAFVIPEADIPFSNPVVLFTGPGLVDVTDVTGTMDFRSLEVRNPTGRWSLDWTVEALDYNIMTSIWLHLEEASEKLRMMLKVVNYIRIDGTRIGKSWNLVKSNRWRIDNSRPFVSTLMAGDPASIGVENLFKAAFSRNDVVLVHDPLKDTLVLYYSDVKHSSWVRSYLGRPFDSWQERNAEKFEAMRNRFWEIRSHQSAPK